MHPFRNRLPPLAALALCLPLLVGFGRYRPANLLPLSLGMGDATVAAGAGTAALFTNPAGMAQRRQQSIEVGGGWNGRNNTGSGFFSSTDSQTSPGLAAGICYGYESGELPGGIERSMHDTRFGLAAGTQSDAGSLSIGVSGRWLSFEYGGTTARDVSDWTGDVGLTTSLGQIVRLGAVWRNVFEIDTEETPRRIATGVAVALGPVVVETDGSWGLGARVLTGPIYRAGIAAVFAEKLGLRGGYVYNNADPAVAGIHQITAGFGLSIDHVTFDVGAALEPAHPSDFTVIGSLTWYVPYAM